MAEGTGRAVLSGRIVLRARAGLRLGTTAGGVAAVGLPLFRAVDAIRAGMRFGIGGDVGGTDTGIPSARPHHRTPRSEERRVGKECPV